MDAVKAYTWKELIEQADIAEKLAKKFKLSVPKNKWGVNNKGRDTTQSPQSKGKETIAVKLCEEAPPKQKKGNTSDN